MATRAQDKLAADGFQVPGERLQTTAKELLAVGTGPRVMFLPVGKYVDEDDFICLAPRAIKRGVVGDSEVAPKPVYDSSHLSEYDQASLSRSIFTAPVLSNYRPRFLTLSHDQKLNSVGRS